MKLKIIYRSSTIWNIILHLFLSFIFIFLQSAIFKEKSVFDLFFLQESLEHNKWLIGLILISAISVYRVKKYSQVFFVACISYVSLIGAYGIYQDFSKLILIVLFFYILVSYYMYHLLKLDLYQAYYNPKFSNDDLFEPMLLKIPIQMTEKKSKNEHLGILTNWNEDGCFIKLNTEKILKGRRVHLSFEFESIKFEQFGEVVSKSKKIQGIGIKFINKKKENAYSWADLFDIITDMGISVEYIK